jgi:hypothetical protein
MCRNCASPAAGAPRRARARRPHRGQVIAEGTSAELKAKVGGEWVQLTVAPQSGLTAARDVLARLADGLPHVDAAQRSVEAPVTGGARRMPEIVRELDAAGVLPTISASAARRSTTCSSP